LDDPGLVKSSNDDILRFIASSFRSVWALELLLVLKSDRRSWSHGELVATMRASELVVTRALAALEAAGLVSNEGDKASYMPVSQEVAELVSDAEALYSKKPDAVRRAIVSASAGDAAAFANAFRLRKD
jgi:DNA-binding HxlR family transcriptional regulator